MLKSIDNFYISILTKGYFVVLVLQVTGRTLNKYIFKIIARTYISSRMWLFLQTIGSSEVTLVLSREAASAESETGQSKRNVTGKEDASRVINHPIQYWVRKHSPQYQRCK